MTEGPRAHAIAFFVNMHMAGRVIEYVLIKSRKIRIPISNLAGKKLERAEAYGKNIIILVDGYAIRVHTLIYGIVRVYRRGSRYDKPEKYIRLRIAAGEYELVGFNTPIVEVGEPSEIVDPLLKSLGPDPLRPDWRRDIAIERLRLRREEKIGVVLLDQGVIAGIGNILRNEVLFEAKINPERLVKDLSDEEINKLLDALESLSRLFYKELTNEGDIKKLYRVYNRYRGRCPICGTQLIYYRQQPHNRKTFVCTNCQR